MQCPKCKHENPPEALFCMKCATKLERKCPKCGATNPPEALFCMKCANNLDESVSAPSIPTLEEIHTQSQNWIPDALAKKYLAAEQQITGENRPITALFADISGSTQLAVTRTSEAMFQLVQDCFKELVGIIASYEGRISGFRGDGLLALFGAPILHENDAERAILAALEMHSAMQKQQLRVTIGINTALMTVGEIQTQLYSEYTAYGTDIVLARRLQESAQPGQILVGAGTYRLTRRTFDFEALAPISVKGFPQPVSAYIVKQVKAHPEKLRGIEDLRARMIGREHEFSELKEATDEWLAGHGQIVSVIGEAGIGKSRLARELKEYLETTINPPLHPSQEGNLVTPLLGGDKGVGDFLILEGRCISIGQPISYWPFIDILKTYFNLTEGDDTSTIARKVTDSIIQLMPQGADETLPLLGQLLSIKYGNELDDRLKFATPEQIRHQTLMRLRDIFTTLARQQPLLLILEDLHWSDDLSLDLISLLMDELANTPLMLLCVYRPDKEHQVTHLSDQAQRKCLDRYTEIILRKLSTIQSRQLVEELLTIDNLPENVKNLILTKSEGNPFFIEEVIRSLIDRDLVYRDEDRWKARDEASSIDVPDTIQSVILSRVDRLQAEAKYVLQCASVIGRLFKYRLLEHLSQQERNLNSYLSEFEERDLVYPEHTLPELEYAFKHALTQETTYQSILERKRREFHHQVAQGIERLYQERLDEYYEELAHHYSRSDDAEKAVEYLVKGGQKAVRRYANQDALEYYGQALKIAGSVDERNQILKQRGKLFLSLYRGDAAANDYQLILDNARDKQDKKLELESILGLMSASYIIALDNSTFASKFHQLNQQAYDLATGMNDNNGIAKALIETQHLWGDFSLISREQVEANVEKACNLINWITDDDLVMDIKFTKFRMLKSKDNTEDFINELKSSNDLKRLKEAQFYLMVWYAGRGDFKKCIEHSRLATELASRIGVEPVLYPTYKSISSLKLGHYDVAWESIQEEIADPAHQLGLAMKNCASGMYFLDLTDYDKAIELLQISLKQSEELKRPWLRSIAHSQLMRAYIQSGKGNLNTIRENLITEPFFWGISKMELMAEIEFRSGNLDVALDYSRQAYNKALQGSRYHQISALELQIHILLLLDQKEEAMDVIPKALSLAEENGYEPMLWKLRASRAKAFESIGDNRKTEGEYNKAAEIIYKLSARIPQADLRERFLSSQKVSFIINKANKKKMIGV